ncbi:MAG: triple tyrosine motif-containing protein [Ginsengibacter sp.]
MKRRLRITGSSIAKFICCATYFMTLAFCVRSQDMTVRIYTTKDGLPSTYVYGAFQDKLDYLWVGSPDGLSRFDGKNFINYGLADGLPDTRTTYMFMDSRLRLWIGTARGAGEFKGNRFVEYPLSDSQNIHWVSQIFETKEGQIWLLTNVGVYQFELNKWAKIKLYPGFDNHPCNKIIKTDEGFYISYGDLLVLKKTDGNFKIIGELKTPGYYYNGLSISGGQIFISTLDGIYEIKNQQLVKLPGLLGRLTGFFSCFRDSKKRFWIGKFNSGIQLYETAGADHFTLAYKGPENFLPQGFSEDNQGNIWVGSGNGLIRISEPGYKIYNAKQIVGNSILRNVFQVPGGSLLINDGSLNLNTFQDGEFTNKKLQLKGKDSLPNNELIIDNYAFDDKNRYWYMVRGMALAMQSGNNIYVQTRQLASLSAEVFDVMFDTFRKKITVALLSQKFPCQYNDTGYKLLPVANNIPVKGSVTSLHQCINNVILFATDRGLIYSIDKENICKLQLNEFNDEGHISKFYNDPSGDVWIIYNGRGLRRYTWQKDQLVFKAQLTKVNGLSSDNASSLVFDNHNNLWVSTNYDVCVFSKKINETGGGNYQIASFFNGENLDIEDSYRPKLTKDKQGNIWLFAETNLLCFFPDKINYNPQTPSIQIENVELNLQETNWKKYVDSLDGIFQLPIHLQLSHENNTLSFYFKGISSSGIEGIKYSYHLDEFKNSWSIPSINDFVSFEGLLPGKYRFEVKAKLPNTNWSNVALFSFEIKKAFWQTWWFYLLAVMALFTAVYLLFRYRLKQKTNLFEMRNRISQDLHDEIGASISGINLLSQIAAERLSNHQLIEASEYISKVKNYSQEVIERLSDMVWIFNPQNDSIEKLLQRLKSFTISIAASKNIKTHFTNDKESEQVNLTIRQRKDLYLISKEAINNALKYAECDNIYYSLTLQGSKLKLLIQDDGKGFIVSQNGNGNGLNNMRARAEEMKANFTIDSAPGKGTIITLEF